MTTVIEEQAEPTDALRRLLYAMRDPAGIPDWRGFRAEFQDLIEDEKLAVIYGLGQKTVVRLCAQGVVGAEDCLGRESA